MKHAARRLSIISLGGILLTLGTFGTASAASTSQTPTSTDPASVVAPAAPAAPTPPTAPAGTATTSLTVGDLTISHPRATFSHDHIDVYLSIKNASKSDERLNGADAGAFGGDVVQVTKDKSGKETESPLTITLTGDKSTDFTADGTWLRIKDVKTQPKGNTLVPLSLYFRRSPNASLKISLGGGEEGGSSVMDWFKK